MENQALISVIIPVYNVEEYPNFTPEDKLVLEINTEVEKNCEVYLYSDTFHKELVSLPNFESVPYWQGSGDNFAFDDVLPSLANIAQGGQGVYRRIASV